MEGVLSNDPRKFWVKALLKNFNKKNLHLFPRENLTSGGDMYSVKLDSFMGEDFDRAVKWLKSGAAAAAGTDGVSLLSAFVESSKITKVCPVVIKRILRFIGLFQY